MFKTRAISAIFIVLVIAVTTILGGAVMWLYLLAISLIAYYELMKAFKVHISKKPNGLEICGYFSICVLYVLTYLGLAYKYAECWLIISFIIMLIVYVFTFPKNDTKVLMNAYVCVIYAPMMLSFMYRIRTLQDGMWLVVLVYIASWISDTCAYCTGMLIGKHKLAPKLSPKKSIEGSLGGVIGAALAGAIYGWILCRYVINDDRLVVICAIIGAIGSVVSQIGDLVASGIKRHNDIKDYGHLIPGHGGIMDRFDSVIMTTPMIYFLVTLFM